MRTREGGLLKRVSREVAELRSGSEPKAKNSAERPPDVSDLAGLTASLWDEWSQAKLTAAMDAFEVATARAGISTGPIRRRLDPVAENAGKVVLARMQDEVRTKLIKPGDLAVRVARRVTGFLTSALPLAALAAVGYRVVVGYFPRPASPCIWGLNSQSTAHCWF